MVRIAYGTDAFFMEEYKEESSMIKTIDGIIEAARGGEPGILSLIHI